ncbi:hypothetical protein HJC23_005630 [Cyclotella cryptica]|uniref:Protein-tyrosine-phosphatase n=1 Tax=Cyclotella cryptica TaxID=29204 RepID=A0ABD3PYW7_9STRA
MAPKTPQPLHHGRSNDKWKKNDDDDADDDTHNGTNNHSDTSKGRTSWSLRFPCLEKPSAAFPSSAVLSGVPTIAKLCFRSIAIATVTLYILNQKHMLPKPLGRVVSRALFWPTIPITVSRRLGKWTTEVDSAVIIGGAPFGFMKYPEKFAEQGVRGVVNMCDEYRGPVSSYQRLGIEHLRLPTVDHFEPSLDDLKRAVAFIRKHESQGGRVYVHCRAGHGRSAAAVYAWLLYKEPLADPIELNEKLSAMRNVRKGLWKQPNINAFRTWLQSGGMEEDSDDDHGNSFSESWTQQTKRRRRRVSSNIIRPIKSIDEGPLHGSSRTKQKGSRDTSGDNVIEHLGRVFSDEEYATTDYDSDESTYDEFDDNFSEDEQDYEMWKRYK